MRLLNIFKQNTPRDEILKAFRFLISDYGFDLIDTEPNPNFRAAHFFVYRNNSSKLQLEICGDRGWFHSIIRKFINDQPANYNDKNHCIDFEVLAIFESNGNYNHLDYFVGGQQGLIGVLKNTARLFNRHKKFFTTDCWLDVKKIRQLEDNDFEQRFGARPDRDKPTFFGELKNKAINFFVENGYSIEIDSDDLPPFDSRATVKQFQFQKNNRNIRIKQSDWRDNYSICHVEVDGQKIFEIDIRDLDLGKAVDNTMQVLRKQV